MMLLLLLLAVSASHSVEARKDVGMHRKAVGVPHSRLEMPLQGIHGVAMSNKRLDMVVDERSVINRPFLDREDAIEGLNQAAELRYGVALRGKSNFPKKKRASTPSSPSTVLLIVRVRILTQLSCVFVPSWLLLSSSKASSSKRLFASLPAFPPSASHSASRPSNAPPSVKSSVKPQPPHLDASSFSDERHLRRTELVVSASYNALATDTNDTISQVLCSRLDPTTTSIAISAFNVVSTFRYTVPTCITTLAPNVVKITLFNAIIADWSVIPANISELLCRTCSFVANTSSTIPVGYDSSGALDWDQIRSRFTSLTSLILEACRLRSLPNSLSPSLRWMEVDKNGYPLDSIPASMLSYYTSVSSITSLTLLLTNSDISGTIPSNFFTPLTSTSIQKLVISFENNSLSGSIAPGLLNAFGASSICNYFELSLQSNQLTGYIPVDLIPIGIFAPFDQGILLISLDQNLLTGPIPDYLFAHLSLIATLEFNVSGNSLIGPLPSHMFNNSWAGFSLLKLEASNNLIDGSIPTTLLSCSIPANGGNMSMARVAVDLSGNKLEGTIPENLFRAKSFKRSDANLNPRILASRSGIRKESSSSLLYSLMRPLLTVLNLARNKLSGTVPSNLFLGVTTTNALLTLNLDSNMLTGQFPDIASTLLSSVWFTVTAANNRLSGNPPGCGMGLKIVDYRFASNLLDGEILSGSFANCTNVTLDVTANSNLGGSIPAELFNRLSLTLYASKTKISGPIPTNLTIATGAIDLSFSNLIDFCSHPWNATRWNYSPATCMLDATTAACNCPELYSNCSVTCSPPVTPPTLTSPQTDTPQASSMCPNGTRPSLEFSCIGGVWTAPFTTTPILTIPSGAGTVIVGGNVTSTSIVINGVGSNIIIRGCAANLTMVTVTLTQEQLKQLGSSKTLQNLVTFSNASACDTNLNGLALDTQVSHGCRKVKTEKVISSDGNTFGAYFTVDASGCNTWWIVLVSVICGVVILGVIAAVIAGVLWKNYKAKKEFAKLSAGSAPSEK